MNLIVADISQSSYTCRYTASKQCCGCNETQCVCFAACCVGYSAPQ